MPTYNNLPKTSEFFKGKWYDKMVEDLQLAGMAKRTVYGYVRAIRKLADFHQKSPVKITENDVRSYFLHQIVDLELASGSQSVLLSGIKFFYRTTCPRKWKVLDQTKINYISALPEVITHPKQWDIRGFDANGRPLGAQEGASWLLQDLSGTIDEAGTLRPAAVPQ